MAKITRTNIMQLWANQYPEVARWLTHLQKKENSALFLYRFCEWAHKTPPELLALKEKDPKANNAEKLLDDFVGANLADFTNAEQYNTSIQVKSFFKWNYRALEKASGVVSYEKVKPYNALSKEGLRKLYNTALNPRDRALIPFVTCTGIAKETLTNLTWGHLEADWETKEFPCINIGPELLKGHGKGKYAGVRQVTFLTPEAKAALLFYKGWMEDKLNRKLMAQDYVWLSTYKPYEPLSYQMLGNAIVTLSDKAKVPFSLHDGRRWINTALESIGISSNWARKIRGRKVKGEEAPYSQPSIEALRAKFHEAVPTLEFTTEKTNVPPEVLERIKKLEDERERIRRQYQYRSGVGKPEPDEEGNCEDGKHCEEDFLQIPESELLGYLREKWIIVKELANGEVIIKNR